MRGEFSFAYKLVVAVREDLRLSPGKLAAQVAHAAVECALKAQRARPKLFEAWKAEGQKKVVVRVADLAGLELLEREAKAARLPWARITDAGHTELPPGTVTCLGIGPAENAELDRITGRLPLL